MIDVPVSRREVKDEISSDGMAVAVAMISLNEEISFASAEAADATAGLTTGDNRSTGTEVAVGSSEIKEPRAVVSISVTVFKRDARDEIC